MIPARTPPASAECPSAVAPPRTHPRLALAAFVAVPFGVLLVANAFSGGRVGEPWGPPLYWTGLACIVAPTAAALWSDRLSRGQTLYLLLAVGLGLYVVNALGSPTLFTGYDEMLHYRTLADIARTGRLFKPNALLRVSPTYPGLELATHALMSVTGLEVVPAGLLIIAVGRSLTVAGLFLFLERVSWPSRLAGLATLLYMAAPSFIAFDASFAYESLAVPLAIFCLFCLREAQMHTGKTQDLLECIGAVAMMAVVATHHVTSYILVATLLAWTLVSLLRRPREPLPGSGWVPVLGLVAAVLWLLVVAPATVSYLQPHATAAAQEAGRIVSGGAKSRKLFQSAGGYTSPMLERVTGLGSVLLILLGGLLGLFGMRRMPKRDGLMRMFTVVAVSYPFLMALRFTSSGWEIGARAMTFVYIPLSFVLATGLGHLRSRPSGKRWTVPVVFAITVVFLGGVISGTSPFTRLPRPYQPGAYSASIESESLAAAEWARAELGPEHHVIADETNMTLMGSYGEQSVMNSTVNVSVSEFFLLPFGPFQRRQIAEHGIEYAVIDRRIAGVHPVSGYFFEKWERDIVGYGETIDPWRLATFDEVQGADRVFDSGGLQIYDIRRLGR